MNRRIRVPAGARHRCRRRAARRARHVRGAAHRRGRRPRPRRGLAPRPCRPSARSWTTASSSTRTRRSARTRKKHQSTVTYKEIKFRPKTDEHDSDFKVDHIRRFLQEGNKARLVVIFRGREIVHPETGQEMLKKVVDLTQDIAHGRAAADDGRAPHAHDHRAARRRHEAAGAGSGHRPAASGPGYADRERAAVVRQRTAGQRAAADPAPQPRPAPQPAKPQPPVKPQPTVSVKLPQNKQLTKGTRSCRR